MVLGHLLTRSSLTYPEVSSKVCHNSFCQLGNSVSLSWVIYYEAFYLNVVCSYFAKKYGTTFRNSVAWAIRHTEYVLSNNHCCSGRAISVTYPESVFVALHIQRVMRMGHIVICSLPFVQYFSTLSHKRYNFRKEKLLNIKFVFRFSLQLLPETFFILGRTERDMTKIFYWSSCEVPVILVRF